MVLKVIELSNSINSLHVCLLNDAKVWMKKERPWCFRWHGVHIYLAGASSLPILAWKNEKCDIFLSVCKIFLLYLSLESSVCSITWWVSEAISSPNNGWRLNDMDYTANLLRNFCQRQIFPSLYEVSLWSLSVPRRESSILSVCFISHRTKPFIMLLWIQLSKQTLFWSLKNSHGGTVIM